MALLIDLLLMLLHRRYLAIGCFAGIATHVGPHCCSSSGVKIQGFNFFVVVS